MVDSVTENCICSRYMSHMRWFALGPPQGVSIWSAGGLFASESDLAVGVMVLRSP